MQVRALACELPAQLGVPLSRLSCADLAREVCRSGIAAKAGRILDLYARCWEGEPLRPDEFVLSTDEKTSIQARIRRHASQPVRPRQAARCALVEKTLCRALAHCVSQ